jgi:hypothetical protein
VTRPAPTPVSVARSIDAASLTDTSPCESVVCLGSFWPYSKHSYESHIVKGFKECNPTNDYQPHISRLCEIYAGLIVQRLGDVRFDWVARALGSTEQKPEPERPLALLESILCSRLGAKSLTHLLYKTESRPAMRLVGQLSGPDVLRRRIQYAAQDLFITPAPAGGRALLIDDIFNTGATMRVCAYALKEFAGIESVTGMNLAATRFKAGRDGHGRLQLDTSQFEPVPDLGSVWLDANGMFHEDEACPIIEGAASARLRFLAEKRAAPCPACAHAPKPKRRFWGLFPL